MVSLAQKYEPVASIGPTETSHQSQIGHYRDENAMPNAHEPIVAALLGVPAVSTGTLYGIHDALCGVRRDWAMLHGGPPTASPFLPLVVSADGTPFVAANGVHVTPQASFAQCARPDIAIVTDVLLAPDAPLAHVYDREVEWLRGVWDAGGVLASACAGALLLARTGLLEGVEATSHWAYCDRLAREHPRTRWQPERGLIVAGAGQRIVMAGSGVAWHTLALALIARFASPKEAMQVARINLFDIPSASPVTYASLTRGGRSADALIAKAQRWVASNYRVATPAARMAEVSGLAERTFKRRFARDTGMTPLEYVHMLRLEEAKEMLEAGPLSIEAIAAEVGYEDASFFSRLFRRKVALTPAQYRRRFGALNARLQSVSARGTGPPAR